jgi:hypothetical protein
LCDCVTLCLSHKLDVWYSGKTIFMKFEKVLFHEMMRKRKFKRWCWFFLLQWVERWLFYIFSELRGDCFICSVSWEVIVLYVQWVERWLFYMFSELRGDCFICSVNNHLSTHWTYKTITSQLTEHIKQSPLYSLNI